MMSRAVLNHWLIKGGVVILTTPVFELPIFSPDFIILFENLQVNKPFKIQAKEKMFGNPLYTSGHWGNCGIIYSCT